jgi:hypothetical protein
MSTQINKQFKSKLMLEIAWLAKWLLDSEEGLYSVGQLVCWFISLLVTYANEGNDRCLRGVTPLWIVMNEQDDFANNEFEMVRKEAVSAWF